MARLQMRKIEVLDDLGKQDHGAIEVMLSLSDGTRRWCYFMTPAALQTCGEWIEGTKIRFHFGGTFMIVVADTLTEDVIEAALVDINRRGSILDCTMAIDEIRSSGPTALPDVNNSRL